MKIEQRHRVKAELRGNPLSLNPPDIKRNIDAKPVSPYEIYAEKSKARQVNPYKKSLLHAASSYMIYCSQLSLSVVVMKNQ